ncbi:gp58-like family protein [Streptococcus suis]|uniref:phage tail spike protein n=1 Tax=Streptococcus suis TaxID=1307 RepID=UPI00209C5E34|nr:gp58-like family protein [Streptococcus suis]HEM3454657.1 phage tail protein [Streptococcus suis]
MIYLFDKDEKLIKIVRKSAVKTALQKYTLTTERYVSDRLTVELKGLNADELEQVEYIAIQTMEDAHTFHYFYVAQKFSDELTTLIGVQSGIEELRKSPVFDKRPKNALARDVITDLLAGTNWQARFVGETTPHSTNFYYTSIFDALKKVCEVWDLEMQFFVEMNGNRIGARYIDFKQRIGEAVGKRVVYGHNALQILQEVERTNIFTALVGRGKGEETGDGYGRKITFENVVWSRTQGKPVDKPKGQKYLEMPLMTRQYGIKNADGSMRPKIGFVDFSEEENPEVLIERTYKALVDAARPQLTLKTSSVYLRGVKVGDTIRVVRHDKKLDYDTRIFEITFNRLNNQSSDIKLGDRIGESNEAKAQTIADKAVEQFITNEFSNFVQNLPDYLPSADGFNNNWYGTEDPTVKYPGKVLINDIWFKPDPEHEGHKIMLRWIGEVWEEILRTYESESLRDRIAEEIAQVEQSMQANESERKKQIDELLLKVGVNKELAEEAKRIGEQAKTDAANVLSKSLQYKNEAIAEATRLDTVERQATETKLATTKSQAISEATRLVETAKSLLSGQISNVSTDLSQTKEAIKLLATRATVDTLTSRVSSAETMIQVQADQISQRVKTSDFDQAKQRISTAESSITQLGNRITTEISETVAKIPTELGIRNLIKGTKDLSGNNPNQNTSDTYLGFNIARSRPSSGYIDTFRAATTINATATSYVTTFYARSDVDGFLIDCHLFSPNTTTSAESSTGHKTKAVDGLVNVRLTTEWTRYWVKWTQTPVNEIKNFIVGRNRVDRGNATVEIAGVALYEGDIPKDWSPAPEDAVAEIENVKTTITQTAEGQVQLSNKLTETAGKVTAAETSIRQLVNDVSSKVSQTIFDNLKRTVESQGTAITQNQSAIALKAEKTYVEGVKSTAESAKSLASDALSKAGTNADLIKTTQAELKITSDAVKTKVSQTIFNAVNDRLTSAETSITTMAGAIETKLSRTDTERIVTNAITQSENGTNQRISQVEGKIPANLGGTNLVRGSAELKQGSGAWSQGHWRNTGGGGKVEYNVMLPSSPIKGITRGAKITSDNSNQIGLCQDGTSLEAGTYTLSVWVLGSSGLKVHVSSAYSQDISNPYTAGNKFVTLQDDSWTLITQTFKLTKRYNNLTLAYLMFDSPGTVYYAAPYIHRSPLPGDWSPAPEDVVTLTKFNEVSDTVDAHKRTIYEQGQSISQVIQTANGLLTKISNISSGSRNLLKGTRDMTGTQNPSYVTKETYQGFTIARTSPGSATYYDTFRAATTIAPTFDTYIISFYGRASVEGTRIANHFFGPNTTLTSENSDGDKSNSTDGTAYVTLSTSWKRYWIVWTQRETTTIKNIVVGRNHSINNATVEIAGVALYEGNLNKSWSPAPEDGDQAVQAVSTQVSTLAGSWAVKNLTNSGTVLNQLNLNKDGSVKIDGSLVQITGKTYIENGVIKEAMIGKGQIGTAHIGEIDAGIAKIINLDVSNIKGLDAAFIKAKIENAFIEWMKGKVITAQNEAMTIGLNDAFIRFKDDAKIEFQSENNTLFRTKNGTSAFIHFRDDSYNGVYTAMGVNADNTGTQNDYSSGSFAGVRVIRSNPSRYSGTTVDQVQLVGDEIRIRHGYGYENDYLVIKWDNQGKIDLIKFLRSVASRLGIPLT